LETEFCNLAPLEKVRYAMRLLPSTPRLNETEPKTSWVGSGGALRISMVDMLKNRLGVPRGSPVKRLLPITAT